MRAAQPIRFWISRTALRVEARIVRLQKAWCAFRSLEYIQSEQRSMRREFEGIKAHQRGLGEVAGDAYARSREKEKVSEFSIRRLNTLEEEVKRLDDEIQRLANSRFNSIK